MTPKLYWIEFRTGIIKKGHRPTGEDGLETYGYHCAQAVSRLLKKTELNAALKVANNGIEVACTKK